MHCIALEWLRVVILPLYLRQYLFSSVTWSFHSMSVHSISAHSSHLQPIRISLIKSKHPKIHLDPLEAPKITWHYRINHDHIALRFDVQLRDSTRSTTYNPSKILITITDSASPQHQWTNHVVDRSSEIPNSHCFILRIPGSDDTFHGEHVLTIQAMMQYWMSDIRCVQSLQTRYSPKTTVNVKLIGTFSNISDVERDCVFVFPMKSPVQIPSEFPLRFYVFTPFTYSIWFCFVITNQVHRVTTNRNWVNSSLRNQQNITSYDSSNCNNAMMNTHRFTPSFSTLRRLNIAGSKSYLFTRFNIKDVVMHITRRGIRYWNHWGMIHRNWMSWHCITGHHWRRFPRYCTRDF